MGIIVDFDGKSLLVQCDYTNAGICKAIPMRRFDKERKLWVCPPTKTNMDFLKRFRAVFNKKIEIGRRIRGRLPMEFKFKTEPYPHQLEALQFGIDLPNFALTMDPGTGKSKVMIDDVSCFFLKNEGDAAIVICPNSIKSNWEEQIEIHSSVPHDVFVFGPDTKKKFNEWMLTPFNGVKWALFAVESFSQGDAMVYAEKFLLLRRCALLIDESSRIKTHDSIRTKNITKLGLFAKRKRTASGTPLTKGPQDLYAQYSFLDPDIIGGSSFYSFRNRYCLMGGYKMRQIVGTMNEDELIQLINPYTYRASKADHLKLPPKVYQIRKVAPSKEQEQIYKKLDTEGYAEIKGHAISFDNVLVKHLRLQQISSGFVPAAKLLPNGMVDENETELIPLAGKNPKIEELVGVLDEIDGKVIIWCRFQREVDLVFDAIGGVKFYGLQSADENTTARRAFMNDPDVKYFIGTQSSGGIGITLVSAATVIYLSNTFMLEDRIQSEDRAHRIGQTADSVLYIDIVMDRDWVDSKVIKSIQMKKDYSDWLLAQMV